MFGRLNVDDQAWRVLGNSKCVSTVKQSAAFADYQMCMVL